MAKEDTDTQALLARVEALEEYIDGARAQEEIRGVIMSYARALDRHDAELMTSLFHEDAEIRYGDMFSCDNGSTGLIPHSFETTAQWANSLHNVDVIYIDIDGDTAHAESYVWFSLQRLSDDKVDFGGGRYVDRLERRDGSWKIAARTLLVSTLGFAENEEIVQGQDGGTRDKSDPSYRRPLVLDV